MSDAEFKLSVTRSLQDIQSTTAANTTKQQGLEASLRDLTDKLQELTTSQTQVQAEVCALGRHQGSQQSAAAAVTAPTTDYGPYRQDLFHGHTTEDAKAWLDRFTANAIMRNFPEARKLGAFRLNLAGPAET